MRLTSRILVFCTLLPFSFLATEAGSTLAQVEVADSGLLSDTAVLPKEWLAACKAFRKKPVNSRHAEMQHVADLLPGLSIRTDITPGESKFVHPATQLSPETITKLLGKPHSQNDREIVYTSHLGNEVWMLTAYFENGIFIGFGRSGIRS
jgi:hypothetical protein